MYVGVMELQLVLFEQHSLKAKRSVVQKLIHRCRNTFNISVAEVEDQNDSDRALLGVVAVGSHRRYVEGLLDKVEDFVERLALAELLGAPKRIEVY